VGAGTALDLVIEWNIKSFVKVTDMIWISETHYAINRLFYFLATVIKIEYRRNF
jgi:hypothetical protein